MSAVSFSHVGITVPDLEEAVNFYTKAFGLYLIMPPTQINKDDSPIGVMCTDVFGDDWTSFRIAHLATGDRIGLELFQFPQTVREHPAFEYWRQGLFHFCFQDEELEKRVELIQQLGGKQRMEQVRHYYPGKKPYRMLYCEDPFGNIFELYSHSSELTYAAGAYN